MISRRATVLAVLVMLSVGVGNAVWAQLPATLLEVPTTVIWDTTVNTFIYHVSPDTYYWLRYPACSYPGYFLSYVPLRIHANTAGNYYYKFTTTPWSGISAKYNENCVSGGLVSSVYTLAAGGEQDVKLYFITLSAPSETTGTLTVELYKQGFFSDTYVDGVTISMGVDKTGPAAPTVNSTSYDTSINLSLSSNDAKSGVYGFKVNVDGVDLPGTGYTDGSVRLHPAASGSATVPVNGLTPGSHQFAVTAYDRMNNPSIVTSKTISTAHVVSVSGGGAGDGAVTSQVGLSPSINCAVTSGSASGDCSQQYP
ncbi:MAG: hypothetical protein EHM35_18840, partial [Planctomycetaceae bacterium]